MAFATPSERLPLLEQSFPSLMSVQVVTSTGNEIELAADDIEHALYIQASWMGRMNARQS